MCLCGRSGNGSGLAGYKTSIVGYKMTISGVHIDQHPVVITVLTLQAWFAVWKHTKAAPSPPTCGQSSYVFSRGNIIRGNTRAGKIPDN